MLRPESDVHFELILLKILIAERKSTRCPAYVKTQNSFGLEGDLTIPDAKKIECNAF